MQRGGPFGSFSPLCIRTGGFMGIGLNITAEQSGGTHILRLGGRVDAVTTPALEREVARLLEGERVKIILDFSKVDYLSSAGMRLLLSATRKLKGKNGALALCDINEEVMEILQVAGFERVLAIFPNEKDALKALG